MFRGECRGWKLVKFDHDFYLESYFHIFLIHAIRFEWLYIATSFLVWTYIFGISRSRFSFKFMGPRSRSHQQKSENYWSEVAGA